MKLKSWFKYGSNIFKKNVQSKHSKILLTGILIFFVGSILEINILMVIGFILLTPAFIKEFYKSLKESSKNKIDLVIEASLLILYIGSMFLMIYLLAKNSNYFGLSLSAWILLSIIVMVKRMFEADNIVRLILTYTLLIVFLIALMSLTYYYYDNQNKGYLKFGGCNETFQEDDPKKSKNYIYFSTVTIFSLGYGDICPMGQFFRLLAGINIFVGHLVAVIVIAVGIQGYIKRKEKKKWSVLSKKVTEELNEQFSGILTDIAMICNFREVMTFKAEVSNEEVQQKDSEIVLGKVKKFAQEGGVKISEDYKEQVLIGNFGTLFKAREKFLSNFQIKYMNYLEPSIIIKLIDVQKAFGFIDQDIIIRNKQVENKWLRLDNDEDVIKRIENNLQTIVEAIQFMADKGILKYK